MILRSDHVAGTAFAGFGVVVLALSHELPFGRLSFPGAGFMPTVLAWLLIGLGLLLALRAWETAPLADIDWNDLAHAIPVIAITAAAVFLYTWLGFILTMVLMMFTLLILVERRNLWRAGAYSLVVVLLAFGVFDKFLKAPLPLSPFGF